MRAREGAALVAKEFALEQLLGNGPTVDWDEAVWLAGAALVDAARHELLAGPGLTQDQHVGLNRGHPPDRLEDRPHRGARAHDVVEGVVLPQLSLEELILVPQPAGIEQARGRPQQVVWQEGLCDVVARAELDGLDGRLDRGIGREDEDRDLRVLLARGGYDLEPADAWHADIGQHEVEALVLESLERALALALDLHLRIR